MTGVDRCRARENSKRVWTASVMLGDVTCADKKSRPILPMGFVGETGLLVNWSVATVPPRRSEERPAEKVNDSTVCDQHATFQ